MTWPGAPVVEVHEGVRIVRDDLVEGGSKVRGLGPLLAGVDEAVYAGPAEGLAQLALARVAQRMGTLATVFVPMRKALAPATARAAALGAQVVQVPAGRLSVLQARARAYCATTGATLLPFGLATPAMRAGLVAAARQVHPTPTEVWVAAGSGTIAAALAEAWPEAALNLVQVGRRPAVPPGAHLWVAPEPFARPATGPQPPVPSVSTYDAKAWRFVAEAAAPGALWWNVAG